MYTCPCCYGLKGYFTSIQVQYEHKRAVASQLCLGASSGGIAGYNQLNTSMLNVFIFTSYSDWKLQPVSVNTRQVDTFLYHYCKGLSTIWTAKCYVFNQIKIENAKTGYRFGGFPPPPSYHLKDTNRALEQTERGMSQRLGSEAGKAGDRSGR